MSRCVTIDRGGVAHVRWWMPLSGRFFHLGSVAFLTLGLWAASFCFSLASPETVEISEAIKNTRRADNFRITAAIKGPRLVVPVEADIHGRNFQLTTAEGIMRRVGPDFWVTRDVGKTWAPTEAETWIMNVILTPIQPDENADYQLLGTEQEDGKVLRHYRLKVSANEVEDPEDLPQFWLAQGDQNPKQWILWRAKCPVMVKDGAFPTVDVRISEIGKIPDIKIPKGMSPSLPTLLESAERDAKKAAGK